MDALRQYIGEIIFWCILFGVLLSCAQNTAAYKPIRLLGGMLLAVLLLEPLTKVNAESLLPSWKIQEESASDYCASAEIAAQEYMEEYIKELAQTYILDKASSNHIEGFDIEFILTDGNPPIPYCAKISGSLSPYAKFTIGKMLTEDLGITKENQIWIDPP